MNTIFDVNCDDKDLNECIAIIAELQKQPLINQHTGLRNRQALLTDIKNNSYSLMALIDIDRLRFINDLYGISIGNQVLKQFSNFLYNKTKDFKYELYQTSGDEFVICTNSDNSQNFKNFINDLDDITKDFTLYIDEISDEISIDITIGVTYEFAEFATLGMSYDSRLLLVQADAALHYAKEHKKKLVEYSESINYLQNMQNILDWKSKIHDALLSDNIVAVYQPIVDENGSIIKYETLMRLRDQGKLISPFFFLEISIMTKQYAQLSYRVIQKALHELINSDKTLSINITYSDLLDDKLIDLINTTLEKNDIGSRLVIEIVESEDIEDFELLLKFIEKFKHYGVKIAIDDFGTGFSNFINIIKIRPDYIKIDGSLIKNIDSNKDSHSFVKAILQVSKELGIKVIAEYVHSKEVYQVLKELGVAEYQGFYFYEPSEEFVECSLKEIA
jgi:diguanylate cyclase (GGDEF)-like protein